MSSTTDMQMLRYVLTVIGHEAIDPATYLELEHFIVSLPVKINKINVLSEDRVFDFDVTLVKSELITSEASEHTTVEDIKEAISECPLNEKLDIIFQKNDEFRQAKKLFCFDMDSTLIYQEVIELIAAYAGVEDEVEKITTAAMNGEIDFKESLARRVKLLRGIDGTIWEDLKKKLEFTKGDHELMKGLKKTGCKLAVLSGGFIPLASYVKDTLNLDYAFANTLKTETDPNGKVIFSGETEGYIVDGEKKAELTIEIAKKEGIDLKAAVAVGDGSNDLKMMGVAGFGIAWNAKPKVQKLAPAKLNTDKISDIFYILGYNDEQIKALTA